jgi:hypothetical protein
VGGGKIKKGKTGGVTAGTVGRYCITEKEEFNQFGRILRRKRMA